MDQNTKRDRDQRMKRDKKSKDAKRPHASKSDAKPTNVKLSKNQPPSMKSLDSTAATIKSALPSETEDNNDDSRLSNLKRETDAIVDSNKSFSKRQITSNWSKYETPLPPEDSDPTSRGADFESLLGAPISEGGHFKFKSEKMWASNATQYSNIFSLDSKHLARGLSSIPFYKQIDLPKECFSVEVLEQMESEANQNAMLLKTTPNEPTSTNFYNILKSSLAETEINLEETVDQIHNPKLQDVKTLPLKSEGVKVQFVDVLGDDETTHLQMLKNNNLSQSGDDNRAVRLQAHSTSKNTTNLIDVVVDPNEGSRPNPLDHQAGIAEKLVCDLQVKSISNSIEDDELDFLLALKEPVHTGTSKYTEHFPSQPQAPANEICSDSINDSLSADLGAISLPNTEEKEDLEDWLDSILGDD